MVKKAVLIAAVTILFSSFVSAKGASPVSVTTNSYQEITVKDKNGKKVKKWVKASKVVPGTIIKYVDTIHNDTNTSLKDAKVSNPINKNLVLVKGSESSKVKFKTLYSVDGGKSFNEPSKLFVKAKNGKKRQATVKDYNAIQFILSEVPAHSKVNVEYKVKLK